jgi:Rieske Fe-S protein
MEERVCDCLNRRDFLAKSAIAAAALVVTEACGDGQIGPPIARSTTGGDPNIPSGPPVTVNVSQFPALATVGVVVPLERSRAVMRTGTNTFVGISRICTHQQCDTDVRNNRFECPCHGSIFASDGTPIQGPNIPAPPNTPLRKLQVTFNAATNEITVA